MAYTPIFQRTYVDGYKDRPDTSTPVTADIKNRETVALETIEAYLKDGLPIDYAPKSAGDYIANNQTTLNDAISKRHSHTNKSVLDKFSEDTDGNPLYDDLPIGGGGSVTSVNGQIGAVQLSASDVGALPFGVEYATSLEQGITNGKLRTVLKDQNGNVLSEKENYLPSGGNVDSVNGKTGDVVLSATDVNALPSDTPLAPSDAEKNVIEGIKVNGQPVEPDADRIVNITTGGDIGNVIYMPKEIEYMIVETGGDGNYVDLSDYSVMYTGNINVEIENKKAIVNTWSGASYAPSILFYLDTYGYDKAIFTLTNASTVNGERILGLSDTNWITNSNVGKVKTNYARTDNEQTIELDISDYDGMNYLFVTAGGQGNMSVTIKSIELV